MALYFFHIRKGGRALDTTELECADVAKAQIEAARLMGEELRTHTESFWDDEEWHIEAMDERGLILFTVYSSGIKSAALP